MSPGLVGLQRALRELAGRARFSVRLGLQRVRRALDALGCPERRYATVHLAGTNGKGSTAALVAGCLTAAGHRTGLFTSPHLHRFSERIRIDGAEISRSDLGRLLNRVLELDEELTFFEVATVAAFCHFAEQGVDLAVLETGLGGRLDATNVVDPLVSVITPIGMDHVQVLGPDLASIAAEKAGIVKTGIPVVSAAQPEAVAATLQRRCAALGTRLHLSGRDFGWVEAGPGRLHFRGWCSTLNEVRVGLRGAHQRENAAVALATLDALAERGVETSETARRQGLTAVAWPGRLEWIGRYLLDCAHNPPAARALAAELDPTAGWTLIFGALRDKQLADVLAALLPRVQRVILTRAPGGRAVDPRELLCWAPNAQVTAGVEDALALASRELAPIVVTGSVYLVGEARRVLLGEPVDELPLSDPAAAPERSPASAASETEEDDDSRGPTLDSNSSSVPR